MSMQNDSSATDMADNSMHEVRERGSGTMQQARERANEVMGQARERASGAMGVARERARQAETTGREKVATGVEKMGGSFRKGAAGAGERIAGAGEAMANRVEGAAQTIRSKDVGTMWTDMKTTRSGRIFRGMVQIAALILIARIVMRMIPSGDRREEQGREERDYIQSMPAGD